MVCNIPFLYFIVSTLQKCTKSTSISFASVSWCASRPAVEAVWSHSQLAAKTCSLQLPSGEAHCFSWLLCPSWGLQWQFPALGIALSQAKPAPKPGPWCSALAPHHHPAKEAAGVSLAEQGLASSALWSCSTGLWLALSGCEIPRKPRGLLLSRGKHAEGLSGLGSYVLLMSGRRKMEIFSMSLFAL